MERSDIALLHVHSHSKNISVENNETLSYCVPLCRGLDDTLSNHKKHCWIVEKKKSLVKSDTKLYTFFPNTGDYVLAIHQSDLLLQWAKASNVGLKIFYSEYWCFTFSSQHTLYDILGNKLKQDGQEPYSNVTDLISTHFIAICQKLLIHKNTSFNQGYHKVRKQQ